MAGDPQANLNFYHTLLGQRLVKRTVNFDDPGTYHFYFADEVGTPGTVMTFFPWPHAKRGVAGNGEASAVAYAVPASSLAYWQERLSSHAVTMGEQQIRFGETVLPFRDPDGMAVELVATTSPGAIQHWNDGPVPAEHALRGFHSVTLWLGEVEKAAALLTSHLGYKLVGREGNRWRFAADSSGIGRLIDLVHRPGQPRGQFGAGSIHHIAFRTADDTEQLDYLEKLRSAGFGVSPVRDRQYFHSIYFRAPGGVLFEVATDAPGFLYDEIVGVLGESLRLPPWLESRRAEIESFLPAINLPAYEVGT